MSYTTQTQNNNYHLFIYLSLYVCVYISREIERVEVNKQEANKAITNWWNHLKATRCSKLQKSTINKKQKNKIWCLQMDLPEKQLDVRNCRNQPPDISKNLHFYSSRVPWFSPWLWMWGDLANQHAESAPFHTYLQAFLDAPILHAHAWGPIRS